MSNGLQRNFLTRQQWRKLEDSLQQSFGELATNKFTRPKIVEFLSQKVGFSVTESNVKTAADTLGLKLPSVRGQHPGNKFKGGFKQYQILRDVCLTMIRLEGIVKSEVDPTFTLPESLRNFAAQNLPE